MWFVCAASQPIKNQQEGSRHRGRWHYPSSGCSSHLPADGHSCRARHSSFPRRSLVESASHSKPSPTSTIAPQCFPLTTLAHSTSSSVAGWFCDRPTVVIQCSLLFCNSVGNPPSYFWTDDLGEIHEILQREGPSRAILSSPCSIHSGNTWRSSLFGLTP